VYSVIYEYYLRYTFNLNTVLGCLAREVILEIIFAVDEIQFVLSVRITDNVLQN
jgi:hypothetical protein